MKRRQIQSKTRNLFWEFLGSCAILSPSFLLTHDIWLHLTDSITWLLIKYHESQKSLLKEYINNLTNTTGFKSYITKEVPNIVKELKSIQSKIKDKVTKIKLAETISVLSNIKIGKVVSDNHVSSLMMSYELVKELKSKL